MADIVQSAFLEAIFQHLLPATIKLLLDELCLPDEVKKELESLTTDFSMLQAYLRDAAQKQQTYEVVRLWLSKLQDVAYDANDLLDECELERQRQKVIRLAWLRNSLSVINPKRSMFLHDISSRVRNMKMKMEDIKKKRHDYGLQPEQERLHITSNQSSSLEPPLILGRDDDKRRILDLLLRPNVAGESNTSVLSIVGIGGLGKTALAQHVYNDDHVKQSFKLRSWVHVSQDFKEEKLTKDILESIDGPSQTSASLNSLQIDLLNKLRGRKYLIVLDEVWIEDWRKWYKFKTPLLQGAVGSKILVTARNIEVAKAMGASTIYPLKPIGEQDCWSLFCYYMAQQNPCIDVNDLGGFSGVIAQRCDGLPSAAADLAFRLCREPDRSRWSSILKTENLQNSNSSRADLSYQLLSSRLKQCFAFCSLFPDGFEFDKEELINLWMAQNFIRCSDDQRMEDVGSEYFDFLERRSLFQYSRFDRKSNRPKYIIHSSIHNFVRYVSKGECINAKPGQGIGKARHLSLTCHEAGTDISRDFLSDQLNLRGVYTLVVFGDSLAALPDDFIRKLENLRALDLSNTILQKLPNSINYLKHLRCLQLRGTKIRRFPDAIGELYFLQTLGLGNCYMLEELPKGIKYLQKLRHIDLHWDDDSMLMMAQEDISWSLMGRHSLKYMPPEIGLLIELQTLTRFVVDEKSGCGLEELENLNQLHGELLISNLHLVKQTAEATKAKLKAKKLLQYLELHWDANCKETLNSSQIFQRRDDVERILCELQPHNGLREKVFLSRHLETFHC
ncbi:putative disease resistance protein RGA3 isoform X2 [Dendrobium catenatum]|uniref:putative disease resistance protein RGA3 isoform X2 n=1 Tax=Dendrobium catenatum TaxID=906689 RepID=UPI0010A057EB|nr:putative disease resistance protein RGA3 isoform X2 [Dendrobium catenatum]